MKKSVITGENLGKNQIPILVNKSSIETLKVLFSALSFEPIGQTFSNSGLTELNLDDWHRVSSTALRALSALT